MPKEGMMMRTLRRGRLLGWPLLLFVLCSSLCSSIASGQVLNVNLIQNPGAEGGPADANCNNLAAIPGWTTDGNMSVCKYGAPDFLSPTSPGPSDRGGNFFSGGISAVARISQVVDVSSAAAQIDSGTLLFTLSGWLGGYDGQDDYATLRVTFKDAAGTTLGTALIGPVLGAERYFVTALAAKSVSGALPSRTRSVQVLLEMTRTSGSYNDGYADNFSFVLGVPGAQALQVSPSGVVLTGVAGGGAVPAQSIAVVNSGQGAMSWIAERSTLSGGDWLTVSPSNGSSTAGASQIPLLDVSANVTGLSAGKYSGLVQVTAPGASDSPQLISVHLNVLPAGSTSSPQVQVKGLVFVASAGGPSPATQTVRLGTARSAAVTVSASTTTQQGGNWLSVTPASLSISATTSGAITVQATTGALSQGVYSGQVNLQFNDGSPSQVVNVVFVVAPTGTLTAATGGLTLDSSGPGPGAGCTPQRLVAVDRSLGANFSSLAAWPASLQVLVVSDCGSTVSNATIVASFSNGDSPVTLQSLGNGLYAATWRPVNSASPVTVTIRVISSPLPDLQVQAQGNVPTNPGVPQVFAGGVVHAASYGSGQALAPGSIVSVFGRSLATGMNFASRVPLETTIGGATLNVGGLTMPLFFSSDGQVNAQLPFELPPSGRLNLVAKARPSATGPENISAPETITMGAVRPGIFSTNQQGTGQGVVLDVGNRLVDSAAPAASGNVVVVYCTGLGVTQPAVASGQGAPTAEPLARVVVPVTATVGGIAATVQFAGLTPGFVGLYQVNVQIPTGVSPGSVPLVLTQGGVSSNTVTLAVR